MSVYAEVCSDCLADEPVIVPPVMGDVIYRFSTFTKSQQSTHTGEEIS